MIRYGPGICASLPRGGAGWPAVERSKSRWLRAPQPPIVDSRPNHRPGVLVLALPVIAQGQNGDQIAMELGIDSVGRIGHGASARRGR